MAYQDPGKEIRRRVDALVLAVNSALLAYYRTNKTNMKVQLSVAVSGGKGGQVRTPADQASYILQGKSWTCNGSHMSDAAAHILLRQGGSVTWSVGQVAAAQKGAWTVLVNAWNGAMATQQLRNFSGGTAFDQNGGDPFHMELPNSRLNDTDPPVIACLEAYAKATRFGGSAKNVSYETQKGSQFQKNWLQAYDQKIAKGWKG